MSDQKAKQKLAGLYTAATEVDVAEAVLSVELAKVWSDEESGMLAVSVDRLLFDSITEIAGRYLEPNGYSLNLENILAVIDSMRFGVFANVSGRPQSDGRARAKKLIPAVFMQLPRRQEMGSVLKKFYDEVGRYEAELSRLHDLESKAKKAIEASIKDDSGKKAFEAVRIENEALREELLRIQKKLAAAQDALRFVPVANNESLPGGIRPCVVRSVRVQEGVVLLKADENQFTVPLKLLGGTPLAGAKALALYEGGNFKAVWVYDPQPTPFEEKLAEVVAVDGRKLKIRFSDRRESIVTIASHQEMPMSGSAILARFSGGYLVAMSVVSRGYEMGIADLVFEQQTKLQLEGMTHEEEAS